MKISELCNWTKKNGYFMRDARYTFVRSGRMNYSFFNGKSMIDVLSDRNNNDWYHINTHSGVYNGSLAEISVKSFNELVLAVTSSFKRND